MPKKIPTFNHETPARTPFFDDGVLQVYTQRDELQHITGFEATYNGNTKVFIVKNAKIKDAWQDLEKWFEKISR